MVEAQVIEALRALFEQPQPLDRIRSVHRAFQREVGVEPLDQSAEGLDHLTAYVDRDLGDAIATWPASGWEVVAEQGPVLRLVDDGIASRHRALSLAVRFRRGHWNAAARPSSAPPWKPRFLIVLNQAGL